MPFDHLWATWRENYVTGVTDSQAAPSVDGDALGQSLFERILAAPGTDAEKYVVSRGAHSFVLLNRFPYTVGHLMVLPLRAVADVEGLTPEEHAEIWASVTRAVVALKAAFRCDGINVGLNLGAAAGGSQSDHLHVHCVPRWVGDANFISVAADTRVLPISLDRAWELLTAVGSCWSMSEPDEHQRSDVAVSDADHVDVLPDELDASAAVVVEFPNNNRRRIPAVIYLVMGIGAVVVSVVNDGSPEVNSGLAVAGVLLALFGLYGLFAGRTLLIDETDALVAASSTVGFPIGHASAQMSWRGLLSRPVWRLLAYSNEDPPSQRAMVVVDGITGEVVEWFAEENPEDWSSY